MPTPYYRPSGRCSPFAPVFTALCCALFLPVAWVYAWSTLNLPEIITLLAVLAFGLALYCASAAIIRFGKVRSLPLALGMGITTGVCSWYMHWAYLGSMIGTTGATMWPGLADFTSRPGHLIAHALDLTGKGPWMLAKWMAECLILTLLPAAVAAPAARRPFCEASKEWVDEVRLGRRFAAIAGAERAAFVAALEESPDNVYRLMGTARPDPSRFAEISLYPADRAGETYLSIANVTESVLDGKVRAKRSKIIDLLRIEEGTASDLLTRCGVVDDDDSIRPGAGSETIAAGHRETPPELHCAEQAFRAQQYEAALEAARPYRDCPDLAVTAASARISALACVRLDRWEEAVSHFETLFVLESSVHHALQLATTCIMAGRTEDGEQWMRATIDMNALHSELPPIQIYTRFIATLKQRGLLREALPYLDPMREIYEQLHITDPSYLSERGVPYFISFLEQSAPIVEASMDAVQARHWYCAMLPHLDQAGREELQAWLAERSELPVSLP
jgi:hypothetical protein